jgi:N-acetylneuraminic acid mutarotase
MNKTISVLLILILIASSLLTVKPVFSLTGTDNAENKWTQKTPMPTARGGLGVAVVEERIYAIGGYNGMGAPVDPAPNAQPGRYKEFGSFLGTNEMYDVSKDAWETKASMPTPRVYFGIAVYQNKIYCFGGETNDSNYDFISCAVNEVYDPSTDSWKTLEPMPMADKGFHANVIDDKIFIIGGHSNATWIYDPASDSWAGAAAVPFEAFNEPKVYVYVEESCTVVFGEKIHYFGLSSRGLFHIIYDPAGDVWIQSVVPNNLPVCPVAAVTSGLNAPENLYIFGENTSILGWPAWLTDFPGSSILIYNMTSDSWIDGLPSIDTRDHVAVAVVDDKFYVIGGASEGINRSHTATSLNMEYTPFGYGTAPPRIFLSFPQNANFTSTEILLNFTVDRPVSWMGYSLDGQENITVTGNITLTAVHKSLHSITVYANDSLGNMGASQTVTFSVMSTESSQTKVFYDPTIITVIVAVLLVVTGVVVLVHWHRKKVY